MSTSFATVDIETHATANSASDGDLWPSCWSDDDLLYTANGDGKGFSVSANPSDIAVSRVFGGFWGPGADAWVQLDDIALDPR
jgi:hypothetical protein